MKRLVAAGVVTGVLVAVLALLCPASTVADGWYVILSRASSKAVIVNLATVNENGANVRPNGKVPPSGWQEVHFAHRNGRLELVKLATMQSEDLWTETN